jgi:hypothetical protein
MGWCRRKRNRNGNRMLFISLLFLTCAAAAAQGPVKPQTVELRAGELTLLLGNEYDHGANRTGYIGIWRLTSIHEPTNVFVPQYAGWIHRRGRATVTRLSETEAVIQHLESDGRPSTKQTFRVIPPYYFDCTFSTTARGEPVWFGVASYINSPEDHGIYFLDPQMQWQRHYDPVHGSAASVLPDGMPPPTVKTAPDSPYSGGATNFRDTFSSWRYHPDYALFYGRFRDMVLVHMFPPRCNVIPYMSPRGGGVQPDGKRRNPAWDWQIIIDQGLTAADVLEEYRRWVAAQSKSR